MKSPVSPKNPIPYFLALAGLAGSISILIEWKFHSLLFNLVFSSFVFLCSLNTILSLIPWHGSEFRYRGVNRHLHLILLPITIIWCSIVGLALTNWMPVWLISLASVFVIFITFVNATLVGYARDDHDKLPPEHFQHDPNLL